MLIWGRLLVVITIVACLASGFAFGANKVTPKTVGDRGFFRGMHVLADRFEAMGNPANWTLGEGLNALNTNERRSFDYGRVAMMKLVLVGMSDLLKDISAKQNLNLSADARKALQAAAGKLWTLGNGKTYTEPAKFAVGLQQVAADFRDRFVDAGIGIALKLRTSAAARAEHDHAVEISARLIEQAIATARVSRTVGELPSVEMSRFLNGMRMLVPEKPPLDARAFWGGANEILLELAREIVSTSNAVRSVVSGKNLSADYVFELNRSWRILTHDLRPHEPLLAEARGETPAPAPKERAIIAIEKLRLLNPTARCEYLTVQKNLKGDGDVMVVERLGGNERLTLPGGE